MSQAKSVDPMFPFPASGSAAATVSDPHLRSDAAAKAILLRLLQILEDNETGVLQNIEVESLHDFRIAVRRTRSALTQIKGVFPDRTVQRFLPRFAWLGQITSEPRDFDVYLLDFDRLKASLSNPFQEDIEPLRGFLENHTDLAHAALTRHLHSVRYRSLLVEWRKFLLAPCPRQPRALNALMPIADLASRRIRRQFRRALRQGRAISPETPAESLHELRKTCKKLRYLLEFFRDLYPPEEVQRPIKHLKSLQDYLGEFQDTQAQIGQLQRISHLMRRQAAVPTEALLAMGVLLSQLISRQHQMRQDFPDAFADFAHADNRSRFHQLFTGRRGEEKL
ncbi:MAG: CHAD domain-containing protein [Methylococcaceae bacterium]|nr:CHAD domain-containing protein [Methylococcaceae bacterium]